MMIIKKSTGVTESEKYLSSLCDKTFLKLWAYPNPYKADGKELCDLLVVFENHVFIFFDRESRKFDDHGKDVKLQWERWEKEVIQKQIATLDGAKKYILANFDKIYLDSKKEVPFPLHIDSANLIVHKIAVAHGAKEACKNNSPSNISGSLAIIYAKKNTKSNNVPFLLNLDSNDPVHIFDSQNLEIILNELDTVFDFTSFIVEKEKAIQKYDRLAYCGEEDLLAHYFFNYDSAKNRYSIVTDEKEINGLFVAEGQWDILTKSEPYQSRKKANSKFQFWDELIQRTCQYAFDGELKGNGTLFKSQSAIYEMAKEPRMNRRVYSERMIKSMKDFPENTPAFTRYVLFMPSFYENKAYVFLQLKSPEIVDYENEYRPRRQALLEIACGALKNRFPQFTKIIGIGIDAPKFTYRNAEDFILLHCGDWPEEARKQFEEANKKFKFFDSNKMEMDFPAINDFPGKFKKSKTISRNEPCPCNSGKKYKRCCCKD